MQIGIVQAATAAQFKLGRGLIEEYAELIRVSLGIDLCFQQLASELEQLPTMYGPPSGCLFMATVDDQWVGCCALRRFSETVCEMKRLYVRPGIRGGHVGRRLTEHVVTAARSLGYERMVLDTVEEMVAARSLYRSLGFLEIAPYYSNPMEGVSYMELQLS